MTNTWSPYSSAVFATVLVAISAAGAAAPAASSYPVESADFLGVELCAITEYETQGRLNVAKQVQCVRTTTSILAAMADPTWIAAQNGVLLPNLLSGGLMQVLGGQTAVDVGQQNLLGIDFWDVNYGGATKAWYASGGCHSDPAWYVSNVGSTWNDEISSADGGYNGCNAFRHFINALDPNNLPVGCASQICLDCGSDCSDFGLYNDKTSALVWAQTL